MDNRICVVCDSSFSFKEGEKKANFLKRKTCSSVCKGILIRSIKTCIEDKNCLQCNKVFHPRQSRYSYCSSECYFESKKGVCPYYHPKMLPITGDCFNCGEPFSFSRHDARESRKYCSKKCQNDSMSKNYPIAFKYAGSMFYGCKDWLKLRKLIKKRDKDTCQQCGFVGVSARQLVIHHIIPRGTFSLDGYERSIHPEADTESNLEVLCRKCHFKEHIKYNVESRRWEAK